ncbi:MAG: flagellar basal body P-ring formation chaperone FlgA [Calditerrivibrio sp.]|nr:flagellar basal body P-ring formation chaperone FlgA [Calditerrivibrio sp.]MCA1981052.1 flagellar basal body P-ring formation chaperone FlgA [Calditerrivibrio sp.]
MRVILIFSIFLLSFLEAFCSIYEIDRDCFSLKDIDSSFIDRKIVCKLNFGEERKVSINLIKGMLPKSEHSKIPDETFIIVKRRGVVLTNEDLKELLSEELKKISSDIRFEIVKLNSGVQVVAEEKDKLSVKLPENYMGTTYFTVNNGVRDYNVFAYIKGYKKVYVSSEKIKKGEPLTEKTVLKEIDITNVKEDLLDSVEHLVANQNIPKNRIISRKIVTDVPEKSKGDRVKIVYQSDTIRLETEGIILEDAHNNSIVKVKNVNSDKILLGKYKDGKVYVGN